MNKNRARGFTLVELVVILAILSILAAVAIPKYVSYIKEARIAALNGLAGAIRSAVVLVQSKYIAVGNFAAVNVTMADATTVGTASGSSTGGIPLSTSGGIDNAVKTDGTFVYTAGASTGTWDFATAVTNCNISYTGATGALVLTTTGC
jgi:MSHA pilin protein MshA